MTITPTALSTAVVNCRLSTDPLNSHVVIGEQEREQRWMLRGREVGVLEHELAGREVSVAFRDDARFDEVPEAVAEGQRA